MTDLAIRSEAMGKRYRIGGSPVGRPLLGRLAPWTAPHSHIWALRDVSFEVRSGDVVGVVGRNGAGKSTLLKILSRITEPTEGHGEIHGRVGSLLEVGTGFHPELTGRENVFLNGAILGMRRGEIARQFDDIVAFAEVEQFIDTPVKRYSSGMYLRLAFAVAAHLEPDILLVDEVLAVGDAAFQRRCLGRMGDVAREGRTVLFVSHNMSAIRSLCDYAIYLKDGRVAANAGVDEVLTQYGTELARPDRAFPVEVDDVVIHAFHVEQSEGPATDLDGSHPATVRVRFELRRDLDDFRLGVYLNSPWGGTVARSFLADWDSAREALAAGRYEATLTIPARFLVAGSYSLLLHASRYGIVNYLADADIRQTISVHAPQGFNPAHPGEAIDAMVLVKEPWTLRLDS